jgi:pimeloyl-ACP methyl ester carboxylesterase
LSWSEGGRYVLVVSRRSLSPFVPQRAPAISLSAGTACGVVSGLARRAWGDHGRDHDGTHAGRGFALSDIIVPVSLWQGGQDRMVPSTHGRWLAEHIPGARAHLYDDEGHLSLVNQVDRILDDLLDLAGLPPDHSARSAERRQS